MLKVILDKFGNPFAFVDVPRNCGEIVFANALSYNATMSINMPVHRENLRVTSKFDLSEEDERNFLTAKFYEEQYSYGSFYAL